MNTILNGKTQEMQEGLNESIMVNIFFVFLSFSLALVFQLHEYHSYDNQYTDEMMNNKWKGTNVCKVNKNDNVVFVIYADRYVQHVMYIM